MGEKNQKSPNQDQAASAGASSEGEGEQEAVSPPEEGARGSKKRYRPRKRGRGGARSGIAPVRGGEGEQRVPESADKPGSVVDNHSSGIHVTVYLKQPTRIQCEPHQWIPIWPCSEWGLPCHGVLPPMRCALTAPFHPYLVPKGQAVSFCCTFRRLAPPRRYLALCSVEPGLSSITVSKDCYRDCLADSGTPA